MVYIVYNQIKLKLNIMNNILIFYKKIQLQILHHRKKKRYSDTLETHVIPVEAAWRSLAVAVAN